MFGETQLTGVIASFLAALLSSSKDLASKRLSSGISGTTSAFTSFSYALPFYVVLLAGLYLCGYESFEIGKSFLLLVFLRAVTDSVAEWARMHAITVADISFISPFLSLAPLFLLFTSPLLTGDQISWAGYIGVLLVVGGSLVVVYNPSRDRSVPISKKGIVFALVASVFFSLNTCFDRLAVQVASPTLSGFAMTVMAALFLYPAYRRQPDAKVTVEMNRGMLLFRGLLEVSFMVIKLFALQTIQAPYVSAIVRSSLLFSILGGRYLFDEGDFLRRLVAGLLICAGVVTIVLLEL